MSPGLDLNFHLQPKFGQDFVPPALGNVSQVLVKR